MTLKTLTAAFAAGLVVASVAVAAPPPGKGKRDATTGTTTTTSKPTPKPGSKRADAVVLGCARTREVELKGTYVSGGGSSFAMLVTHAAPRLKDLKGKQVTVMTDAKTRVHRRGRSELAKLVAGDRLNVHARTCRAEKGATATDAADLKFLARKVDARPAKPKGGTTTGTTTTGTTTTTTTTSP